jgi:hypothetical protein
VTTAARNVVDWGRACGLAELPLPSARFFQPAPFSDVDRDRVLINVALCVGRQSNRSLLPIEVHVAGLLTVVCW